MSSEVTQYGSVVLINGQSTRFPRVKFKNSLYAVFS